MPHDASDGDNDVDSDSSWLSPYFPLFYLFIFQYQLYLVFFIFFWGGVAICCFDCKDTQ